LSAPSAANNPGKITLQVKRDMNQEDDPIPLYREVQHFRQVWIWAMIIAIAGLMWYGSLIQLLLHRPFGTRPMSDSLLFIFWLLCGIGLPAFFYYARLITEVRHDGIYLRYVPVHRSFRKIAFNELKRYEVRTYRPIIEYGGWGIRYGPKGKAYNVSGNRGLQLELISGKRLLIGSQQPEEFLRAVQVGSSR
jgi:hypothetical protein